MNTRTTQIEKELDHRLVEARRANLRRLSDIEHRLEYVDTVDEVEYVNDAKAADFNSSWYSIDCMERPVVWIIGSSNQDDDYALCHEIETANIKALVVLGANPEKVEEAFSGRIRTIARAENMMNALRLARSFTQPKEVVLYSPAFSDFERYAHYKERGQQFRKAVREMQLTD